MPTFIMIDGVRRRAFFYSSPKGNRLATVEMEKGRWEFRVRKKGKRRYEEVTAGDTAKLRAVGSLVGQMQDARIAEQSRPQTMPKYQNPGSRPGS